MKRPRSIRAEVTGRRRRAPTCSQGAARPLTSRHGRGLPFLSHIRDESVDFRGCDTSAVLNASLPTELERPPADATRGRGSARASADLTRRYRDPATPSGPVARSPEDVRAYAAARL